MLYFEHFFQIYKSYIFFPIYFLIRTFLKTDFIYCKKHYDTYYDFIYCKKHYDIYYDLYDEENNEYY